MIMFRAIYAVAVQLGISRGPTTLEELAEINVFLVQLLKMNPSSRTTIHTEKCGQSDEHYQIYLRLRVIIVI